VVNVVSAAPPAEPLTRLRLRGGLHDNPPHSSWDWSEQAAGFVSAELSHGRRFGPFGFWARAGQWHDDGYRENGDLDRTNVAAQLQLEAGADTLGLFGAWARERYGASLLWCMRGECDDPEQLAFQPFKVPEAARDDRTRSDKSRAHLTHRRRWNESFSSFERLSYQRNDWLTDFGADSVGSVANVYGAEVQVGWQTTSRLFVTAGSEAAYTDVEANLFGSHDQTIIALYGQGELGIAPWLTLTAGARLDVVLVDGGSLADPFSSQLSPRLGVVLEPDAVTRVRASVGRGFRAPTVAELFTATEVGGFLVIPNPDLKPERSLAGELGAQRLISSWLAVDVAGFMYWLKDYIEADTVSGGAGTIEIRFDNLREARIAGVEAIALLSLVRDRLRAQLAYTYLHTEDETTGEPLAYRPTHMVTASGALRLGRLELGADYRYASAFDAVKVFTDERTDPIVALNVLDLRAAYRIGRQTVRFVVDNSLNYAYTTIERNMAPTRRYTLAAELEF
jgi:outer membrane cobalamin receptor